MRRVIFALIGGIPAVILAMVVPVIPLFIQPTPGAARLPEGVPACVSDDYNDGSQPLCYTYSVGGEVIFINAADEVITVS